jgi:hypothetical protein
MLCCNYQFFYGTGMHNNECMPYIKDNNIFFTRIMDDLSAQYLGHEAMSVAKLAAQDDRIIRAFKSDNPSKEIQPIAEKMRKLTGAVISLSEINGVFVIPTPIRNILVNQWGRAMSLFLSSIYPCLFHCEENKTENVWSGTRGDFLFF